MKLITVEKGSVSVMSDLKDGDVAVILAGKNIPEHYVNMIVMVTEEDDIFTARNVIDHSFYWSWRNGDSKNVPVSLLAEGTRIIMEV